MCQIQTWAQQLVGPNTANRAPWAPWQRAGWGPPRSPPPLLGPAAPPRNCRGRVHVSVPQVVHGTVQERKLFLLYSLRNRRNHDWPSLNKGWVQHATQALNAKKKSQQLERRQERSKLSKRLEEFRCCDYLWACGSRNRISSLGFNHLLIYTPLCNNI